MIRKFWNSLFDSASRVLITSYLLALLCGTMLLAAPFANQDGAWHLSQRTLCLAASAVCVTGLDPVCVGTALSRPGLVILAFLVQLGGLGIMTIGTFCFLAAGQSLSMREEHTVMSTLAEEKLRNVRSIVRAALRFTVICELLGAVAMGLCLYRSGIPGCDTPAAALLQGLFYAVMSFCNAGFALAPDNLAPFWGKTGFLSVSLLLSLIGGIGFVVTANLLSLRPWRRVRHARGRLSLHSRVTLEATFLLLSAGTVLFFILEWNGAFRQFSPAGKLGAALFHASSIRSPGFSVFDCSALSHASTFLSTVFMFIGAAPGSTGGGIKCTTVVVLFCTVRAMFCSRKTPELHHRSIPRTIVNQAVAILMLCLLLLGGTIFALLLTEAENTAFSFPTLLFEAASAFGNCGLEIPGTTQSLSDAGLFVISLCMFAARLGPATIIFALFKPHRADLSRRYPEENITVG